MTTTLPAGHRTLRQGALTLSIVLSLVTAVLVHPPRPALAAPGDITTVAGSGRTGSLGGVGDGGPVMAANLISPYGVTTAGGRYYLSQNLPGLPVHRMLDDINRVRMVGNGTISTVAGGADPPLNDGAPATQAGLYYPGVVVSDAAGNLYIADGGHGRVRRVDAATGVMTTYAGASVCPTLDACTTGPSGDGGPATQAYLSPGDMAFDSAGDLYVTDRTAVRRIDAQSGIITTVAGGGSPADGVGDGGPATGAALRPAGIAFDAAGDLYISDAENERVRKVDHTTQLITTVAGDGTYGYSGDGGPATSAQLFYPYGISLDTSNDLYIADGYNNAIRKVDPNGVISTFAGDGRGYYGFGYGGDGGPATSATLNFAASVYADGAGNVFIDDAGNYRIRKVDASGTITTVVGSGTRGFFGDTGPATAARMWGGPMKLDAAGDLLFGDANNDRVRKVDRSGTITTVAGGGVGDGLPGTSATLNAPRGLTTDATGNLLIADCGDGRVRKVDASGTITSIAGSAGALGLGDGGAATSAHLECPSGLAVSGSTLYIADSLGNRVRKVDGSGTITTVAGSGAAGFSGDGGHATAAQLSAPSGLVIDSAGDLYIADTNNNRVRRVDPNGTITTIAGSGASGNGVDGVATRASVTWPVGLAIGPNGSLTIGESGFARVRSVDSKGIISTIAGNGIPGYSGDGGPGPLATVDGPTGVAYDAGGNLLVADNGNSVIRSIAPGTPPPPPPVTKKTANCGMTVTQNLTLADDIGPCPGDGVVIGADGVHLNLNGHMISGNGAQAGTNVGIRATGRQKIKISGGTVTGFDAGVAIIGGSTNVVTGMTVANNLGSPNTFSSIYGDGIVMFSSSKNTVAGNTVADNGPFDGIGMISFGADDNVIQNNVVKDTNNLGHPFNPGIGLGIVTNPFLGFDRPRSVSLYRNQIVGNTVTHNGNAGISSVSNINGVVRSNVVSGNGFGSPFGFAYPGNGIGVSAAHIADQNTNELVEYNQTFGNRSDGIQAISQGNQILDNTADGNGRDLQDYNRIPGTFDWTCATNTWSGNVWGSGGFAPACTSTGGHPLPDGTTLPTDVVGPISQGLGDPQARQAPG